MTRPVRERVRALVDAVIGEREDAAVVQPVLTAYVQSSLADFARYYDVRHARNRVRDFDILRDRNRAARATAKVGRDT
jgi:hypothetical protein